MIILTIRSDKPEAEIGLFNNEEKIVYEKWQAHHQLSSTILKKIETLLQEAHKDWHDINAVICYKGPGSFTGLRIGLTVGNSLAAALGAAIVSTGHDNWIQDGIKQILNGKNEHVALPEYGRDPHITPQKR